MAKRVTQQVFAKRSSEASGLIDRLLDLIGNIPEPREQKADDPDKRARVIARIAAAKAASTAGVLALPPGPMGWVTIAPELYAVWKIQAQMVADIAGAFGKPELLSREQMLYCLFSHTSAKAFSDLVIRVGERYLVRRAPVSALYAIANKVSMRIAQRSVSRVFTRWVPAVGALGIAGYVFFDTGKVADASIELFAADLAIEGAHGAEDTLKAAPTDKPPKRRASKAAKPSTAAPKKEASAGKKATGKLSSKVSSKLPASGAEKVEKLAGKRRAAAKSSGESAKPRVK